MKRAFIAIALMCLISFQISAGAFNNKLAYPPFQAGTTGAWVEFEPGGIMKVDRIEDGTPAAGQLRAGDRIVKVNDRAIEGDDPRVPLGKGITEAEAGSGMLRLTVEREGRKVQVAVKIPALGAYSKTWPLDCTKSDAIIKAHAEAIAASQTPDGWFGRKDGGLHMVMGALFLLSTADPAYDQALERYAHALAGSIENNPSRSSWALGYHLIFLSEYYLKTGDEAVLPAIASSSKRAAESQAVGAWSHYTQGSISIGYVQSGLMNSAGVTVFLGLTLARECGVTEGEEAFQRALRFFGRNVGFGSISYGDHRAEIYADTNGRNAAIACALSLLDEEPYTTASQHLAMMIADSYFAHEFGHTGGGFNVLWRGIAMPHVPEDQQHVVRRHMEELTWYYDTCRLAGGGFSMLPSPPSKTRYTGADWGQGMGLTYTAPLKTLRITGAPRTKHSKKAPPVDAVMWGNQRDSDFLSTKNAEGYGEETHPPHVTFAKLSSREPIAAEYAAKYLHHYNPVIRTLAGRKLTESQTEEAYKLVEAALQHPDVRVRRSACDAISGYDNWRSQTGVGLPRDMVSDRFAPHIDAILNDPDASLWEIDGALWALSATAPEDIRRNRKHIEKYAASEDWYLRESAFWAMIGLGKDINSEEFLALADRLNRTVHVFERAAMDGGIGYLLQQHRAKIAPEVMAQFANKIGNQIYDASIAFGYDETAARHEAAHRMMMVMKKFPDPAYREIAGDLARYMATWEPSKSLHSTWMITGNKWQIGLFKVCEILGKDAAPIIKTFEHHLKQDHWDLKDKNQAAAHEAMLKAVEAYRALN